MTSPIKTGEEFRPAPQLKKLYYLYFLAALIIVSLVWFVPYSLILVFAGFEPFSTAFSLLVILITLLALYWIPKYYRTITYKLTGSDMTWRRGVWFRNTGIVPYNRITNIDITQGPVSRALGIASLRIQTAGYSGGQSGARLAEIQIEGVEKFEELREFIMAFVRGKKPVAVETYSEADAENRMLGELVKIRKLLEKRKK